MQIHFGQFASPPRARVPYPGSLPTPVETSTSSSSGFPGLGNTPPQKPDLPHRNSPRDWVTREALRKAQVLDPQIDASESSFKKMVQLPGAPVEEILGELAEFTELAFQRYALKL